MMTSEHPPAPIIKQCRCGQSYTQEQWDALEFCGLQDLDEDGDQKLELRHCVCKSTICIERS